MSDLTEFYSGKLAITKDGVYIDDILGWNDEKLEECHDYIQWLFPLTEPSQYNPNAPLFTQNDLKIFRTNFQISDKVEESINRMMKFYGFYFDGLMLKLVEDSYKWWASQSNHNWLRITRILRSMRLMGWYSDSKELFFTLMNLPVDFDRETIGYWAEAAYGPIVIEGVYYE